MPLDDTHQILQRVFAETFEDSTFDFTPALVREDIKAWDSLGHIRLISGIEEAFDIRFALEDFDKLTSVERIASMVAAKRA